MMIKQVAEESYKTKKLREKLKKHLNKIDVQITKQQLNLALSDIQRWIARHATSRVSLTKKSFSLFDENQNSALSSQKVNTLIQEIKQNLNNKS